MRKELDEYLVKRYPTIFRNRHAGVTNSCMAWGFSCGDGWFHLLNSVCASIVGHIEHLTEENERNKEYIKKIEAGGRVPEWIQIAYEKGKLVIKDVPDFVADQVKEKFGTLRFYYHGGDDYIAGLVSMAETMSGMTCDVCGSPGQTGGRGWIRTRCEQHQEGKNEQTSINVGDETMVLKLGEMIEVEVVEVISDLEFRCKRIFEGTWNEERGETEDYSGPDEYYIARLVQVPPFLEYWDAEKIE